MEEGSSGERVRERERRERGRGGKRGRESTRDRETAEKETALSLPHQPSAKISIDPHQLKAVVR